MVVKGVKDNLITESEGLAFGNSPTAIPLDFFGGKWIGRDQSIVSCMPPGLWFPLDGLVDG